MPRRKNSKSVNGCCVQKGTERSEKEKRFLRVLLRRHTTGLRFGSWSCANMRQDQNQITNRAAYSPAEFAGTCGRHPSWAYRLLYSGKIRAVTELGRILIPASELERVLSLAQPYNPQPKEKPQSQSEGGQS
jgi:hypothetical protein